jgi:hypothetical protein
MKKSTVFAIILGCLIIPGVLQPIILTIAQERLYAESMNQVEEQGSTSAPAIGVEQIDYLYTAHPAIASMFREGYQLRSPVRVIMLEPDSFAGKVMSAGFSAAAMSIYPVGIFCVGHVSYTLMKHELYHWWEQEQQGWPRWFSGYFREYLQRLILYRGDRDLAVSMLSYEQRAWQYAAGREILKRPFRYCAVDFNSVPGVFQRHYGIYDERLLELYF